MQAVTAAVVFFSVLFPAKTWFAPDQPIHVRVEAPRPVVLMLTDFTGKPIDPRSDARIPAGEATVELRELFTQMSMPGTYVLYAVPTGENIARVIHEALAAPLAARGARLVRVRVVETPRNQFEIGEAE